MSSILLTCRRSAAALLLHIVVAVPVFSAPLFPNPALHVLDGYPSAAESADFNHDGLPDLAIGVGQYTSIGAGEIIVHQGGVRVLLGEPDGGFHQSYSADVGPTPGWLTVADLDRDGNLDLIQTVPATAAPGAGIALYFGDGQGGFSPPNVQTTSLRCPERVRAANITGGPSLELFVADACSTTSTGIHDLVVLALNGAGTYGEVSRLAVNAEIEGLVTADFDGDDISDAAVAASCSGHPPFTCFGGVATFLGVSDGTLVRQPVLPAPAAHIVAGDFDENGNVDLAFWGGISSVSVLLGLGNGSFAAPTEYPIGVFFAAGLLRADVDSDQHDDLIATSFQGIRVLFGAGDGTFSTRGVTAENDPVNGEGLPAAGDFDHDGRLDLTVVSEAFRGGVYVLQGDGAGIFGTSQRLPYLDTMYDVALADLDGNGHDDAIFSARNAAGEVDFLNDGAGNLELRGVMVSGQFSVAVAAGDLDRDHRIDLVAAVFPNDPQNQTGEIAGLRGNGLGDAFPAPLSPTNPARFRGPFPADVALADLDEDDRLDLLALYSGLIVPGVLQWEPGNGDGTFGTGSIVNVLQVGHDLRRLTVDDIDDDHHLDVVTTDPRALRVFLGDGNGGLTALTPIFTDSGPIDTVVAEVTGDAWPDLVVIHERPYEAAVYPGFGGGQFGPPAAYPVGEFPTSLVVRDLDSDGIADILTTNYTTGDLSFLKGRPGGGFEIEQRFGLGFGPNRLATLDLARTGRQDLLVAANIGAYLVPNLGTIPDSDADGTADPADPCTDPDGDGFGEASYPAGTCAPDNCPGLFNPSQEDADHDGAGDACDNCAAASNHGQRDSDHDGQGDACETCNDRDGDGLGDPAFPGLACAPDNCPDDPNPAQGDADGDGIGDACEYCVDPFDSREEDSDSDGTADSCDPCIDPDRDGLGNPLPLRTCPVDFCPTVRGGSSDPDLDGLGNECDNCPAVSNPSRADADGDGAGDACDLCPGDPINDPDLDGRCAADDNCPRVANVDQADGDQDLVGDVCDNCPLLPNHEQADLNGNDLGDACEPAYRGPLFPGPFVVVNSTGEGVLATTADFDSDGALDILTVAEQSMTMRLSRAHGDGTFEGLPVTTPGFPSSFLVDVVAFDADGDPWLDVALLTGFGGLVRRGSAAGTFGAPLAVPFPRGLGLLTSGDFNGDGRADLLGRSLDSVIEFLGGSAFGNVAYGRGDGTFEPLIGYRGGAPTPSAPFRDPLIAADFNADGYDDAVVGDRVLLGHADGTLTPASGQSLVPKTVADFNGDGHLDVFVAVSQSQYAVRLGNGDGTFGPPIASEGAVGDYFAAGDFDGDGRVDVASTFVQGSIRLLAGLGDGRFAPPKIVTTGLFTRQLFAADMDHDGRADLLSSGSGYLTEGSMVLMQRGDADRLLDSRLAVNSGPAPFDVAVDDLNGDDHQDFVTADGGFTLGLPGSLSLHFGDGLGGIASAALPRPEPWSVETGDLNGDGLVDVVSTDFNSSIVIHRGAGGGVFGPGQPLNHPAFHVTIADVDLDGDADLVTDSIQVLLNQGNGTFVTGSGPVGDAGFIASADVNGDGAPDLVSTGWQDAGFEPLSIRVRLNNAHGVFTISQTIAVVDGGWSGPVAIADFDRDGHPDLAACGAPGLAKSVSVWKGDGAGHFGSRRAFALTFRGQSVTSADVNRDGVPDLIVSETRLESGLGAVSVLLGRGDLSFGRDLPFHTAGGPLAAEPIDWNEDDRIDIVGVNFGGPPGQRPESAFVLLNEGPGPDFDSDGVPDAEDPCTDTDGDGFGNPGFRASTCDADNCPDRANAGQEDANDDGAGDACQPAVQIGVPRSQNGALRVTFAITEPEGETIQGVVQVLSSALRDPVDRFKAGIRGESGACPGCGSQQGAEAALQTVSRSPRPREAAVIEVPFVGRPPESIPLGALQSGSEYTLRVTVTDGSTPPVAAEQSFTSGGETVLLFVTNQPPTSAIDGFTSVECSGVTGGQVSLDGSGSTDPDSTPDTDDGIASYEWFEDYGTPVETLLGTGATLSVTLPLGNHTITLKVTDTAAESDTETVVVTVQDTLAPALACAATLPAVECTGAGGAYVTVTATATDQCGRPITAGNDHTAGGLDASGPYALGTTSVVFTATDDLGHTATCTTQVTVQDTRPPTLSVLADPSVLWPPNHDLVPVETTFAAQDVCDNSTVRVELVAITSSETDDASGSQDGATTGDIAQAAIGTADSNLLLRAERDGKGPGRVYELIYRAIDGAGNTTTASAVVTVPHDQGQGPEPLLMRLEPLSTTSKAQRIFWPALHDATGYDVIRGTLSQVRRVNGVTNLGPVSVLTRNTALTTVSEPMTAPTPPVGEAYFYLVQQRTPDRGASGWGSEPAPWPRTPGSCEGGCPSAADTPPATGGDQRPARR